MPQSDAIKRSPAQQAALNRFLGEVERRAFRMAEIATRNPDEALDVVQDAMLVLVRNYGDRSEADWRPLFHRILQSRINDWYRRRAVRAKVLVVRQWFGGGDGDELPDPIDTAPAPRGEPGEEVDNQRSGAAIIAALKTLPRRQQQAFMLRAWEGLDVAATAHAMGCSEGSVKTHYFRATRALQRQLEVFRP
ncbi:MAG TPA: RNA polymerase sigma factor [Spongiibacteraceae bacterium]|nr:RNA polymerase sigma factor [Spongiibacteraceae bacterium]